MSDVSTATIASRPPVGRDVFEFGVINMVLGEHPRTFTEAEVIGRVSRDNPQDEGQVHEAIRELVSFGVLHREGERLHASLPAIRVYRLDDDHR